MDQRCRHRAVSLASLRSDRANQHSLGRVFRSSPQTRRTVVAASSKNQCLLLKETQNKTLRESVRSEFGKQYIDTAKRALDLALETGRFTHAVDAAPIHHLLLANVVAAACR